MDGDLGDLLGLFLDEARERLVRLGRVAPEAGRDPEAARTARRELHALKGAARMIGLADLAALCHRAEELAGRDGEPVDAAGLVEAVDGLAREVEALGGRVEGEEAEAGSSSSSPGVSDSGEPIRAPAPVVDRVTELGTQLKILAAGMEKPVADVRALAALAERGVREEDPAQALAALAASLRHVRDRLESVQVHMVQAAREQVERLLDLQMQPLEPTLLELARHARELAHGLGKTVRVETSGGTVRLDRRITETLVESLRHLVRNAVDHGIEDPAEREAAAKPREGTVTIRAEQAGRRVRVVVRDDGRGLDLDGIRKAAEERGIGGPEGEDALADLVFLPGFTTRREASELSGRGIGLDAVASAVRAVGGTVRLESEPGFGLTVTLDLPAARRGRRILVATVHDLVVGIPLSMIRAYHLPSDVAVSDPAGDGVLRGVVGARTLNVLPLGGSLGGGHGMPGLYLELEAGGRATLLPVTSVRGVEEVLSRSIPLHERLGPFFREAAVLGSGAAVPVLTMGEPGAAGAVRSQAPAVGTGIRRLRVLLVDDSPVTREMERRLLEDAGLFVEAVADGTAALARLVASEFDCLVTDIEMPGMDGLELTRSVRASGRFGNLPIVLVSTRNRPEDRMAGLEAGADAYMAKQELAPGELPGLIRRLTGVGA